MIAAMRRAWPVVLLLALAARPATAQPPIEVSGGYALARDPRDEVTLSPGWIAGTAFGLGHAISAVADVSGQYKTIALIGTDARLSLYAVLGGLRAAAKIGPFVEFGQLLTGVLRATGSAAGSSTTRHSLTLQPGVGLDYPVTERWAARAQIDFRLIASQPDAANGATQWRFAAAVVYRVH
jgi:hypothetical protein